MKYTPHDYQTRATNFILEHPKAGMLLEMGLGKTVITMTAIDILINEMFEVDRVLVIAPKRVAEDTWTREHAKWDHLRHLRVSKVLGSPEQRRRALATDADIYVIGRDNVVWLVDLYQKLKTGWPFDMIVIDELSSFKNPQAKRFRALRKVMPRVSRVVGLTGTPSANGLMDLWAEFRLLDMGQRLGRFITQYRNNYFMPDKRNGQIIYSYKPLPYAEESIYRQISDITISMKSTDYLQMPELISSQYEVQLSEDEKNRYEQLKAELVLHLSDEEITAANAASLTGKLVQLANGAIYTDTGDVVEFHDRKLDALEDLIESANEKPVLVAYWFKHDLQRIKKRFAVRELKSSKDIEDWNNGKIPVAVIHPASAGHGLNLQAGGSTLIWFGLTWSLELYQQTNARLWRQGQTDRTVVIQHIITKGTIDERILKALSQKELTQNALIDAVKANL